jgi:ADP-ribose pyrophosphatase YjhB (NUDIX family)
MPPPERYNKGYNVGVGGAVVHDGRLLLVRRASRRGRGNWQVPGGFVEQQETIEEAVVREVEEESGVKSEVEGVLAIRNRYDADNGNSLYIVMLLRMVGGAPKPDAHEVDRAEFFTMDEILELEQVPAVNIEVAQRALDPKRRLLSPKTVAHSSGALYTLFLG